MLKRLVNTASALEDFKTAAAAFSSLASITADETGRLLPPCDCPFLKAFVAYSVARRLVELGHHQEPLKLLETALTEAKRGDPVTSLRLSLYRSWRSCIERRRWRRCSKVTP